MAYQSQYTGAQHDAYVTKQSLIDLIYPVGAIYMSVNSTSPATLFGGTWVEIEGKFLVGADSTFTAGGTGGSDKHTHTMAHTHTYTHTHTTPATTTGSHTLTVAEIPSHKHGLIRQQWYSADSVSNTSTGSIYSWKSGEGTGGSTSKSYTGNSDSLDVLKTGGGGGHTHSQVATTTNSQSADTTSAASNDTTSEVSNLPPYLSVYMWKRTE